MHKSHEMAQIIAFHSHQEEEDNGIQVIINGTK